MIGREHALLNARATRARRGHGDGVRTVGQAGEAARGEAAGRVGAAHEDIDAAVANERAAAGAVERPGDAAGAALGIASGELEAERVTADECRHAARKAQSGRSGIVERDGAAGEVDVVGVARREGDRRRRLVVEPDLRPATVGDGNELRERARVAEVERAWGADVGEAARAEVGTRGRLAVLARHGHALDRRGAWRVEDQEAAAASGERAGERGGRCAGVGARCPEIRLRHEAVALRIAGPADLERARERSRTGRHRGDEDPERGKRATASAARPIGKSLIHG